MLVIVRNKDVKRMTVALLREVEKSSQRMSAHRMIAIALLVLLSHAALTDRLHSQDQLTSQWNMTNTAMGVDMSLGRQAMQMVVNTTREITANQSFKRVRVHNSNVIDALPLEGGNRLQISAKATGITQIDLKAADESVHTIEVMVLGDVRALEATLRQHFPDANLKVFPIQQACIVSGYVAAAEDVEYIVQIAEQFFPTVINKIQVAGVHTVQLQVQIMEISRTKLRELGIDWALANGDDAIASTVGGILSAAGTTFTPTGSETFTASVAENGTSFFTAIRALKRNNLVKVLASPTLVAVDGRPASFNSGGEIPIIVPAGLGQVGIEFREFGTRLDFVAKVLKGGKIWLEVRPYVSEIDPTRSVSLQGINVPGLRSRFLETGVELGAGQTLALGGLLQVRTEAINTGLPILADMPYVGSFFRSVREEQNEIELLITVTPTFAGAMNPNEVPSHVPGTGSQSPTDRELFSRGYLETPLVGDFDNCAPISPVGPRPVGVPGLIEEVPTTSGLVPAGAPVTITPAPVVTGGATYGPVSSASPGGVSYGPAATTTAPASATGPAQASQYPFGAYGGTPTPAGNQMPASPQPTTPFSNGGYQGTGGATPNGNYVPQTQTYPPSAQNGVYSGTNRTARQPNYAPSNQPSQFPATGVPPQSGSFFRY